jgi:hypothetical protein
LVGDYQQATNGRSEMVAGVSNLADSKYQAVARLGLLSLFFSVAEWGIDPSENFERDPAACGKGPPYTSCAWNGPSKGRGKHLRSVSDGGIGVAHLDVAGLADFIEDFVLPSGPHISPADQSSLTQIAHKLQTNPKNFNWNSINKANSTDWHLLSGVMGLSLATEAAQIWIIDYFLHHDWLPSYEAVAAAGGTVEEALVYARIHNSASDKKVTKCMLQKASGKASPQERVDAELAAYVSQGECHVGRASYIAKGRCRPNLMLRPAVVFAALSRGDSDAWGAMATGSKWHVCRLRL